MAFSLEQALAEYFNNTGGGGVWYGGTGQGSQITGAPIGGGPAPTGAGAAAGSTSGGSVAPPTVTAGSTDLYTMILQIFSPWLSATPAPTTNGTILSTPICRTSPGSLN